MWKYVIVLIAAALSATPTSAPGDEPLSFNRDVRPILSDNCFHCHGADAGQRQAELRLDLRDQAIEHNAIVPGEPQRSLLVERIVSTDPELKMPPPDSHRALTPPQIETLVRWVREGATYDKHWAFKPIERPAAPSVLDRTWSKNEIDRFVVQKLEANSLRPSPQAPLPALLRRLSLDLVGLPASSEQLAKWQAMGDPVAAAIDELLASPHYGERMATDWLDVARYADTHGFNNDAARTMWPWRDWVVQAFNDDMPYDQFITEQLAGDLLPNATHSQRLATGFNRNHVINSEGGIIDEEYRVEYVADRVRTTSLAWLGLTMECARCHDHKFDPVSQREYYQLFAFFNNVDETGEDGRIANASPLLPAPSQPEQAKLRELRRREELELATLQQLMNAAKAKAPPSRPAEAEAASNAKATPLAIDAFPTSQPFPAGKAELTLSQPLNSKDGWALTAWVKRGDDEAAPLISTMDYALPRSSGGYGAGAEVGLTRAGSVEVRMAVRWPAYATQVVSRQSLPPNVWRHVAVVVAGNKARDVRIFIDGVEAGTIARHDGLTGDVWINGPVRIGNSNRQAARPLVADVRRLQMAAGPLEAGSVESSIQREIVRFAAAAKRGELTPQQRFMVRSTRLAEIDPAVAEARKKWLSTHSERLALARSFPSIMVMQELARPRKSFVLVRGQYDQHGDPVTADVPQVLGLPLPAGAPRNRLTLARWLTDSRHPLTARVVMNRLWQQLFGVGLVKTASDFGMQSEFPSHPELLDWLAAEFIANGWDFKHMVGLIAGSAVYQQDSAASAELWQRDPENRLLARGPRQRLSAEMIRDQALAVSGLLNDALGGPPAYPYQPADYYKGIVVAADYPGSSYTVGTGADLYRRSLYTFWKRTVPHPTLSAFDAPDREFCVARRSVTNTPLQALVLMNDPTFLEAARKLGERMLAEGGADDDARLAWGFRAVTARTPSSDELSMLHELLAQQRREFSGGTSNPESLLQGGASAQATSLADAAERAAYASLGSLLLNLDEAVTRN